MAAHADELHRRKRELHIRIGRSRRRVDRRLHAVGGSVGRLTDWRTYAARYPGWFLAAGFGVGMAASAAFRSAPITRWLSRSLIARATAGLRRGLVAELARLWRESDPHE